MPKFSQKSNDRLKTCAWDLQIVFQAVVRSYDCTIIEGHRGEVRQNRNFKSGLSKIDWPDGKHNSYPSQAVDVSPYPIPENWGNLRSRMTAKERDDAWKARVKFYQFASVVKFVAKQMGVKIRWGGDWDSDGDYTDQKFDDLVHFELL